MTRPTGEDEMSNETEAAAMTDPKLLPLPEGVDVIFSPDGNGAALDVFTAEQVQDYARANVAHATAPLQAEIEALRVRADAMAGEAIKHEARAERLAEAIRAYKAECDNPAKDYVLRAKRRDEMFALLRDHDQEGKDG